MGHGYRWDIVRTGSPRTPMEKGHTASPSPEILAAHARPDHRAVFGYALPYPGDDDSVPPGRRGRVRLHGTVYDGAGEPVPDALLEMWQPDRRARSPSSGELGCA